MEWEVHLILLVSHPKTLLSFVTPKYKDQINRRFQPYSTIKILIIIIYNDKIWKNQKLYNNNHNNIIIMIIIIIIIIIYQEAIYYYHYSQPENIKILMIFILVRDFKKGESLLLARFHLI